MLINLIDGGIKEIYSDSSSYLGCETCDYGSKYTNKLTIEYKNSSKQYIEVSQMYDYPLQMDFLMKLFIINLDHIKTLTEDGCREFIKEKIKEECPKAKFN